MSAAAMTGPETWVNMKVIHEGQTRRFKLRLRDLGANQLESKIQENLKIPADTKWTLERYSDSLAAYVLLDINNQSVYKQLYRAAKAKLKLKLRVNIIDEKSPEAGEVNEEATGPKPASVEDIVEETQEESDTQTYQTPAQQQALEQPLISLTPDPQPLQDLQEALDRLDCTMSLTEATERMKQEQSKITKNLDMLEVHVNALSKDMGKLTMLGNDFLATTPSPPAAPSPFQNSSVMPVRVSCPATGAGYAVCCNICDRTIPGAHYHCTTCDDGDFDLCLDCSAKGETCRVDDHWLIKRQVRDGVFVNSTTVKLSKKLPTPAAAAPQVRVAPASLLSGFQVPQVSSERATPTNYTAPSINKLFYHSIRTCNCCVREMPEHEFVHCNVCEDFDLCQNCFIEGKHGHHPQHGFGPAVKGTVFLQSVQERLAPGRNQAHNAYCDECDTRINGVRHKCLDCPDWDYCNDCYVNAKFVHPGHRFAPIYDHIEPADRVNARAASRPTHGGIKCDGPLCAHEDMGYIRGVRYKCAVCHDTDFCENCEASPVNLHNKTHPLIKFRTPVHFAKVTTTGAHGNGTPMPVMGDKILLRPRGGRFEGGYHTGRTLNTGICTGVTAAMTELAAETKSPAKEIKQEVKEEKASSAAFPLHTGICTGVTAEMTGHTMTPTQEVKTTDVQTVADLKPSVPLSEEKPRAEEEKLDAVYVDDLITDGTVLPPNYLFVQKWTLRNKGNVAWPVGCRVTVDKKSGCGDYMGVLDSTRAHSARDLEMAQMTNAIKSSVAPGEEATFQITLRTPISRGRKISYWRLATAEGKHFGNRLWTDINVQIPEIKAEAPDMADSPTIKAENIESAAVDEQPIQGSQMIFPKLEKESPAASVHQEAKGEAAVEAPPAYEEESEVEDEDDDEWKVMDEDSNGFLTDGEYDVLDASDEEYLEEQQKELLKK